VNHPIALSLVGVLAKRKNELWLPLAFYERALREYPSYAYTYFQYGAYLVEIDSGQLEKGIGLLQKAVELDPRLAPAHAALASGYDKRGELDKARRAREEARRLEQDDDASKTSTSGTGRRSQAR
jgi:tetratricopeptide (TPR) repeat protein